MPYSVALVPTTMEEVTALSLPDKGRLYHNRICPGQCQLVVLLKRSKMMPASQSRVDIDPVTMPTMA